MKRVDFNRIIKFVMVIWYSAWVLLITSVWSNTNRRQKIFHGSLSKIWLINVSRAHLIRIDIKQCESWNVLLGFPPFVILHNNDLFSLLPYSFTDSFNYENNYAELEKKSWEHQYCAEILNYIFYLFYNSLTALHCFSP